MIPVAHDALVLAFKVAEEARLKAEAAERRASRAA
jgi:hypothetical protein